MLENNERERERSEARNELEGKPQDSSNSPPTPPLELPYEGRMSVGQDAQEQNALSVGFLEIDPDCDSRRATRRQSEGGGGTRGGEKKKKQKRQRRTERRGMSRSRSSSRSRRCYNNSQRSIVELPGKKRRDPLTLKIAVRNESGCRTRQSMSSSSRKSSSKRKRAGMHVGIAARTA